MIVRMGRWTLKATAVWIALVVGSIVGSKVGGMPGGEPGAVSVPMDGPLSPGAAFLAVTALYAAVLAGMAARARIRGISLALFLFVVLFGAQAVLMQIETVFFSAQVAVPTELIPRMVAAAGVTAIFGAAAAALTFRPVPALPPMPDGLIWRIPAVAVVYVCVYFGAGYLLAWQSSELRAFYGGGADIELGPLAALQVVRGILWALLAWLMVRNLTGALVARATMVALAFSVFGAAQLLYPNPYMPWAVRLPHLIEIGLSNALFGAVAVVLLLSRSFNPMSLRGTA